jgi:hypothetical protein
MELLGGIQAKRHQQYLPFFFSLLSFSLDEKETKNQDKKELQRSRPTLARIFVDPTLAKNQTFIFKIFKSCES